MRANQTTRAIDALNAARGLAYPMQGFTYWADIKGDGRYRPALWVIINEAGGVSYSMLNAKSGKVRVEKIKRATEAESTRA